MSTQSRIRSRLLLQGAVYDTHCLALTEILDCRPEIQQGDNPGCSTGSSDRQFAIQDCLSRAAASVPLVLVHNVVEGLVLEEAAGVVEDYLEAAFGDVLGVADGYVRGHQDVGESP